MNSLIDNATISSATGIFRRKKNGAVIREINLVGLDNIIESYILNDISFIDSNYWKYWIDNTPAQWQQYFYEGFHETTPIKIDFTDFTDFAKEEMVFFLLNTLITHQKKKTCIEYDFLTYTGNDFESYTYSVEELFQMDNILKTQWKWDYHHANQDHIDTVMMAYRTIKYIEKAEEAGMNLVCHPIRNEFLNEIGYAYGLHKRRAYNIQAYSELKQKIVGNIIGSLESKISGLKNESKLLWKELDLPLLSSIVYENSSDVNSIFREASKLRIKMAPFRSRLTKINQHLKDQNFSKADKLIGELIEFINNINFGNKNTKLNYSAVFGFPWAASLRISPDFKVPRYLRIFSDLSNRFNLPNSYITNCQRLFSKIRWNEEIKKISR